MRPGLQTFAAALGDQGCFVFSIISIADDYLGITNDIIRAAMLGIEKGYIFYDWDRPNHPDAFLVKDPAALLSFLVFKPVSCRVIPYNEKFQAADNEYTVVRYVRKTNGKTITHFRRRALDSLLSSQTVKSGHPDQIRIFTIG